MSIVDPYAEAAEELSEEKIEEIIDDLSRALLSEEEYDQKRNQDQLRRVVKLFGDEFEPYAFGNKKSMLEYAKRAQEDYSPPAAIHPWQVRIGLSTFLVPPINIQMNKVGRVSSLGGALRATASPKFNSGHSETMLSMTLYFPTHETIWGFDSQSQTTIDFSEDQQVVDKFMSSLRGLITQFKYAPFLPIENPHINQQLNIQSVALESMTISTVENYPFCLMVQLNMKKFNHEVYVPMVDNLDAAIHWGRYRQYIGQGAATLTAITGSNFLTDMAIEEEFSQSMTVDELTSQARARALEEYQSDVLSSKKDQVTFHKRKEWLDGKNFELYYPARTPAQVAYPDLTDFRSEENDEEAKKKNWWQNFLGDLGFDYATEKQAGYEDYNTYWAGPSGQSQLKDEELLIKRYLETTNSIMKEMGPDKMDEYVGGRVALFKEENPEASYQTIEEVRYKAKAAWFMVLFKSYVTDPALAKTFEYQQYMDKKIFIKEWEVPMEKLGIDDATCLVQSVNVSLGNNLVKMPLQMQEEPAYQHVGSHDTTAQIEMLVFTNKDGTDALVKITRAIEHINGLARLEHGHGVLGFFGIKNVVTALCGMKYAMVQSFTSESVPNQPGVYRVVLSLIDFDVFQQKREMLSTSQQEELLESFSKRNPFLRLKQQWAAFSAYPDLPLGVRDDNGKLVGHLDPDYYFKAFETIDPEYTDFTSYNPKTFTTFMDEKIGGGTGIDYQDPDDPVDDDNEAAGKVAESFGVSVGTLTDAYGVSFTDSENPEGGEEHGWWETNADQMLGGRTKYPELGGARAIAEYQAPYMNGGRNPSGQFQTMLMDTKHRDRTGRMVRAFPTYMLWLIDEGGSYAGVKLYDNFYGLQSVIDIASSSSEDSMDDTLVIQLSNIYSRLSTPYRDLLDESIYSEAKVINTQINRTRNLASGLSDYLVQLDTIDLKPGVRVHLRLGYSANPNNLSTVFNGVISEVQQGEIVTITCQSDTVELSQIINSKDENGKTSSVDGSLFGSFNFSEPRDLMTRLLSMGGSTFRENVAHATQGKYFSENRFGIRHFGTILTEPMTETEKRWTSLRGNGLTKLLGAAVGTAGGFAAGGPLGAAAGAAAGSQIDDIWNTAAGAMVNMSKDRCFELYKRNIYPGNGTGVSQYMGGDFGDGGLAQGFAGSTGISGLEAEILQSGNIDVDQLNLDTEVRTVREILENDYPDMKEEDREKLISAMEITNQAAFASLGGGGKSFGERVGDVFHPFSHAAAKAFDYAEGFTDFLGITTEDALEDDDIAGGEEVSFRAFTYMKSVWDMFQTCAALLPNYIVAVRPFEDRSTVFYGKPHWNWTSAVIPISTGIPKVDISPPDAEMAKLVKKVMDSISKEGIKDRGFYDRLSDSEGSAAMGDPLGSVTGMAWNGDDVSQLPADAPGLDGGRAYVPVSRGVVNIGMHLPTDENLVTDIQQHMQLGGLAGQVAHPFFMDRSEDGTADGDQGGDVNDNRDDYEPWHPVLPSDVGQLSTSVITQLASQTQDFSSGALGLGNSGGGQTILSDDNPSWPGRAGAWGYLPPEHEQWYIAMDWNYNGDNKKSDCKKTDYRKDSLTKKILVYNTRSKRGVIACPGAYKATTTKEADISPDIALICDHQPLDIYTFGFVDDSMPLGPVTFDEDVDSSLNESLTEIANITGGSFPNFMLTEDALARRKNKDGSMNNSVAQYAYIWGWKDDEVPPDYTDNSVGMIDAFGSKAREVYGEHADAARANRVWKSFRNHFFDKQDIKKIFFEAFPNYEIETISFLPGVEVENTASTTEEILDLKRAIYDEFCDKFKQFMWRNAYHRGWLVLTVDKDIDLESLLTDDLESVFGFIEDTGIPLLEQAAGFTGAVVEGVGGAVDTVTDLASGGDEEDDYSWAQMARVWFLWLQNDSGQKAIEYMQTHVEPGRTSAGIVGLSADYFVDKVWNRIANVFSAVTSAVGAVTSAVVNMVRMSMMILTNGLDLASASKDQANILNKVYNDTTYYAEGEPGTLEFFVDNPFTREYHEPVVEVREPFQRVHILSSFGNIIDNKIQEFTGVPTVVTATSNGENPTTVYFDKGAPTDKQVEVTVETGLVWDAPDGFVDGVLNPVDTVHSWATNFNGGKYETSAKRVALWFLKESLKDIYGGEIIIIGDAEIRPHDLIYIGDVYNRIYGLCEVEQVVHHFNAEVGFITSITPNALVTINDPTRWSMTEHIKSRLNTWHLRRTMKATYGKVRRGGFGIPSQLSLQDMAVANEASLLGSISYTGGNSALVKDFAASAQVGQLMPGIVADQGKYDTRLGAIWDGITDSADLNTPGEIFNPGTTVGKINAATAFTATPLLWAGWKYVKNNLMDQQGCYIQYLNKNGRPMYGGLGFNRGVAVGQQRVSTMFRDSLRIELPKNDANGNSMIASNDILSNLGWETSAIDNLTHELDIYTNNTLAQIYDLAGRPSPSNPPNQAFSTLWVQLKFDLNTPEGNYLHPIEDGDTLHCTVLDPGDGSRYGSGESLNVRLAGIDAPEIHSMYHQRPDLAVHAQEEPGVQSYLWLISKFERFMDEEDGSIQFALRMIDNEEEDMYGRQLAYMFLDAGDDNLIGEERKERVMSYAKSPLLGWRDYMPDGTPYTVNWESVVRGHSNVYLFGLDRNLENEGVEGDD